VPPITIPILESFPNGYATGTVDTGSGIFVNRGYILFLLILSGFFFGSETALTAALRRQAARLQAEHSSVGAQRALGIPNNERLNRILFLLGNNLGPNILAASLATALFNQAVRGKRGRAWATLGDDSCWC